MSKKLFKDAVEDDGYLECYRVGLKALGSDSIKVRLGDTSQCGGSGIAIVK